MFRYFETLFRHKLLFIIPIMVIPIFAIAMTFVAEDRGNVSAVIWVQSSDLGELFNINGVRRSRNSVEAQLIKDRLKTATFRNQVMERSGLKEAIINGAWPQPSAFERRMSSNPYLRRAGKLLFGMKLPSSTGEAFGYGLDEIGGIRVSTSGNNLLVIRYVGPEPVLGQRLIEEIITGHQQAILASRIRESDVGEEIISGDLITLESRLNESMLNRQKFEAEFPPPLFGLERSPIEQEEFERLREVENINRARYYSALNRLENLRTSSNAAITVSDLLFQVIDPPIAGGVSSSVNIKALGVRGIMGVTLGFILGVVAIVVVTWRDELVRNKADLQRLKLNVAIIEMPLVSIARGWSLKELTAALGIVKSQRAK